MPRIFNPQRPTHTRTVPEVVLQGQIPSGPIDLSQPPPAPVPTVQQRTLSTQGGNPFLESLADAMVGVINPQLMMQQQAIRRSLIQQELDKQAQGIDLTNKAQLSLETLKTREDVAELQAKARVEIEDFKAKQRKEIEEFKAQTAKERDAEKQKAITERHRDNLQVRQKELELRMKSLERTLSLPIGTLVPEVDEDGVFTGRVFNNKTGAVNSIDALAGGRKTALPEATKSKQANLAATKSTIARIRKAVENIESGKDVLTNAVILNSQMAFFGNVARTLAGEVGVLTDQDINRVAKAVPGVLASVLGQSSEEIAKINAAKIQQLEDIFEKIEAARSESKSTLKKPPKRSVVVN